MKITKNLQKWDVTVVLLAILFIALDVNYLLSAAHTPVQELFLVQYLALGLLLRFLYIVLRGFFYWASWDREWFNVHILMMFDSLGYERFTSFDGPNPKPIVDMTLQKAEALSDSKDREFIPDKVSVEGSLSFDEGMIAEDLIPQEDWEFMAHADRLMDKKSNTTMSEGEVIKYLKKNLIISGTAEAILESNGFSHLVDKYIDIDLVTRGDFSYIKPDKTNSSFEEYYKLIISGSEECIEGIISEVEKDLDSISVLTEALIKLPNSHVIIKAYYNSSYKSIALYMGSKSLIVSENNNKFSVVDTPEYILQISETRNRRK